MPYQAILTAEEVTMYIREVFPEAEMYGWSLENVEDGEVLVSINTGDQHIRPGGTVSGPTLFALADIAAYMLVIAHVGKVALAVTTNLNINFLNKPRPGRLEARGTMLKLGKRLAVCDIRITSGYDPEPVAHATATYSIPPR